MGWLLAIWKLGGRTTVRRICKVWFDHPWDSTCSSGLSWVERQWNIFIDKLIWELINPLVAKYLHDGVAWGHLTHQAPEFLLSLLSFSIFDLVIYVVCHWFERVWADLVNGWVSFLDHLIFVVSIIFKLLLGQPVLALQRFLVSLKLLQLKHNIDLVRETRANIMKRIQCDLYNWFKTRAVNKRRFQCA